MRKRLVRVPAKMKGKLRAEHAALSWKYAIWGLVGGSGAILAIGLITQLAGCPLLIGSFAASAVLLFGASESPLAQPRNLVGGHLVSALVAVGAVFSGGTDTRVAAVAVGVSICLMYLTRTMHPPGGATALLGVQSHAAPSFVLVPVLSGSLILLLLALFTNNVVHHRQYPKHWI